MLRPPFLYKKHIHTDIHTHARQIAAALLFAYLFFHDVSIQFNISFIGILFVIWLFKNEYNLETGLKSINATTKNLFYI